MHRYCDWTVLVSRFVFRALPYTRLSSTRFAKNFINPPGFQKPILVAALVF